MIRSSHWQKLRSLLARAVSNLETVAPLLRSGAVDSGMLGIRARGLRISFGARAWLSGVGRCSCRCLAPAPGSRRRRGRPVDGSDHHRTAAACGCQRVRQADHGAYHPSRRLQRRLAIEPGWSKDRLAEAGAARVRADHRGRCGRRYRVSPDHEPDRGKNRWRAALRRGVYAGRDRFPHRSGATPTALALGERLPKPLVPSSIHDSLMERLDRLGPAKRVAQIASVFGRQFTHDAILPTCFAGRRMKRCNMRCRHWRAPGSCTASTHLRLPLFTFKHAMIQEAAYSSLLQGRTGASSTRASRRGCFRRPRSARVTSPPCSVITMRAQATLLKRSRPGFRRVNRRSADRPPREAVAHLREGLSLIPKLPASPQRFEAEIALQSNLAMAYTANAGMVRSARLRTL